MRCIGGGIDLTMFDFGQLLALLKTQLEGRELSDPLPVDDQDKITLERLRKHLQELESMQNSGEILSAIPPHVCLSEPFLKNNEIFLLALFLKHSSLNHCTTLYEHLNSCFACTEVFSDVVTGFAYIYSKLETDK